MHVSREANVLFCSDSTVTCQLENSDKRGEIEQFIHLNSMDDNIMHMSEGRWVNKGEGLLESNTHREVFELEVKQPIRTQTLCGEDTLAKSRKADIRRGDKTKEVLKINSNKTFDFQQHATKKK